MQKYLPRKIKRSGIVKNKIADIDKTAKKRAMQNKKTKSLPFTKRIPRAVAKSGNREIPKGRAFASKY